MSEKKKISWADIADEEDELDVPVVISRHGIKVAKKSYTPPHQRSDKSSPSIEDKNVKMRSVR
jgi:hypothetical protein